MTPAQFAAEFDVPRETLAKLDAYAALLAKWNAAINLVAKSTLADVWQRHFADSAQLFPLLPPGTVRLVDLGSGAGFPGLVLAILGVPEVHLVESDARKAAFLREAARVAGVAATVHAVRIETLALPPADVVTARALAELPELLPLAHRLLKPEGVGLFPKGRSLGDELTRARLSWTMSDERFDSRTDPSASVLRVRGLAPVASPTSR